MKEVHEAENVVVSEKSSIIPCATEKNLGCNRKMGKKDAGQIVAENMKAAA